MDTQFAAVPTTIPVRPLVLTRSPSTNRSASSRVNATSRSAPYRIRDSIRFGFEWPGDWSFEVLAYLRGVGPVPARRPSIDLPKEHCDVHRQAAHRSTFCTLWAFHFIMKPARGGEAVGAQKDALSRVSDRVDADRDHQHHVAIAMRGDGAGHPPVGRAGACAERAGSPAVLTAWSAWRTAC